MTSNIERVYPFQVLLPAAETRLDRDSKAQAEQVRSIAVERVGDRELRFAGDDLFAVDATTQQVADAIVEDEAGFVALGAILATAV